MTKAEILAETLRIRNNIPNRKYLNEEDKNWLIENVFKYHPNWNEKSAKPIKGIVVNNMFENPKYANTRCFYLIYKDNTYDNISFRWAIKHIPSQYKGKNIIIK